MLDEGMRLCRCPAAFGQLSKTTLMTHITTSATMPPWSTPRRKARTM